MIVAIVLGNRLNDDGSLSQTGVKRAKLAAAVIAQKGVEKVILSGGVANKRAGISEARTMKNYLVQAGVDGKKLILEEQSLSTKENALYSLPIAVREGATKLFVCTTSEHANRLFLKPFDLFSKEAAKFGNLEVEVLTEKQLKLK